MRIFGIILILASSGVIGCYYSMLPKFRIDELSEMKKALNLLSGEIDFSISTLAEACESISEKINSPVKEVFNSFKKRLENKGKLKCAWEEALEENRESLYLTKEDISFFKGFGLTLGQTEKRTQLKSIEQMQEYIEAEISEEKIKDSKNGRLYKSMGALIGMLIVVALV